MWAKKGPDCPLDALHYPRALIKPHFPCAQALARMAVEMQKLCATLTAPDGSPVVMRVVRKEGRR